MCKEVDYAYFFIEIQVTEESTAHHPVMNFFEAQLLTTLEKVYIVKTQHSTICQA